VPGPAYLNKLRDVRCYSNSGPRRPLLKCPLSANSEHSTVRLSREHHFRATTNSPAIQGVID
jgi:hypothetical protein